MNNLTDQLKQIGLRALPADLDDFLARAIKARWSPRQILEHLAQTEIDEHSRRSLERRLRFSGIKKFKPMADFEWNWPSKIERDIIERALTLARNSHRMCAKRSGRGSRRSFLLRRSKNDIHRCNVYYAERAARPPRTSQRSDSMSFCGAQAMLRPPHASWRSI